MDIYEKRVKELNLAIAERMLNNMNHGNNSIIYSIKESEDEGDEQESTSVMSNMTIKTNNSYRSIVSPDKSNKKSIGTNANNPIGRPVLESLGKTRKAETTKKEKENTHEEEGENKYANEPKTITQDDRSEYSEMTIDTNANNKKEEEMQTEQEEKTSEDKINEEQEVDDNSEMTGFTMKDTSNVKKATNENMNIELRDGDWNNKTKDKPTERKAKSTAETNLREDTGSEMSNISKVTMKNNEKKTTTNESQVVKNPYNTPSNKVNMKRTYASAADIQKETNKVSNPNKDNYNETDKKYIQLRFTFTKQKFNGSKDKYFKQTVYEVLQCAKEIDVAAGLMTWEVGKGTALNGNEVRLLSLGKVFDYLDLPKIVGDYYHGVTYYGNGIRISTTMRISKFVNRWNYKRYSRGHNNPFKNWKAIKPAETQFFTFVTAIGYFAGSTEKGDYTTLQKEIKDEFNGEVEISYQTIYQPGISQRIWNEAKAIASAAAADPTSHEHKRLKFGMSPSALVVYVRDQEKAKKIRKQFMVKYGEIKNGVWPRMHNGSAMRFVPLVQEYVKEQETRDEMYASLRHQVMSKAGEVMLDLKYCNIYQKTNYFEGSSLKQIIHEYKTANDKDIPLYKHITT